MTVPYVITAPDRRQSGRVAGIAFEDGRAQVDKLAIGVRLLFQRLGFRVEETTAPAKSRRALPYKKE
ncbi:hypothetical protein ACGH2B_12480 [Streptomyces sp. BBFR2]|uniref:hypothetical protein n=1 Tax=Streptomyces sp. BBFR2 TaxID=3372854 RepID=UPI0037DA09EE